MESQVMQRALSLARRGRYTTSPNPMVGAVILDSHGQIVGEGYHKRPGGPHAEIVALRKAGEKAQGGTLYVTLEPCNHVGRTPPCTEAIIDAGITHVVIAMTDPNPEVKGGGIQRLKQAGITVEVGDGEKTARALNHAFITWSQKRRPYITLKSAMSLDGKVATKTGDSRYITHEKSLAKVHELRRLHDAILVGVGTILADDPALTYRGPKPGRDPIRVILDSHGRTPASARIFQQNSSAPTLIFTTSQSSIDWQRDIFSAGGEVIEVSQDPSGVVDLHEVLAELASRHVLSVLVEGGPRVHASFIAEQLADEWYSFISPIIIGGVAPTPVMGEGIARLADAYPVGPIDVHKMGEDVMIHGLFGSVNTSSSHHIKTQEGLHV
ncbi:diaminohydroxyphosphoribosylaminopyrimidine deaminase / 5-amino-6-(5-phosphoribosylamino)uracil reductase [Sulfobacillus thermosulfidooxidans DSM 9293]|uniref:Riboflavin biosynthesis protein RibD n=1 Tax=Sulfobacillus thermosulfidooxidans (strain DSM 9293 / VKM B-1269 / AT-1) TaxID=929705 RepID=A0A1W1W9W6_SULTA|nr:bifunctional diaminohydroxyphosphoribosylaminopyrimidine deaminase/5-amino-6-(5-phosphoribosylamino)uracil reductase RibD [Sulfobacillus thermosulfidooxidans]SMC03087.1 diaminohydroxyphosphoribosylaminopyrimidine deaminase / 5-amino-6-(5-phosphoribosylamino)uracil reductase [Sulfobacillus thermosulfidooxidans DSM 9293]